MKNIKILSFLIILFLVWASEAHLLRACFGNNGHFAVEPISSICCDLLNQNFSKSKIFLETNILTPSHCDKCIDIPISTFFYTTLTKQLSFFQSIPIIKSFDIINFKIIVTKNLSLLLPVIINKHIFLSTIILLI